MPATEWHVFTRCKLKVKQMPASVKSLVRYVLIFYSKYAYLLVLRELDFLLQAGRTYSKNYKLVELRMNTDNLFCYSTLEGLTLTIYYQTMLKYHYVVNNNVALNAFILKTSRLSKSYRIDEMVKLFYSPATWTTIFHISFR